MSEEPQENYLHKKIVAQQLIQRYKQIQSTALVGIAAAFMTYATNTVNAIAAVGTTAIFIGVLGYIIYKARTEKQYLTNKYQL